MFTCYLLKWRSMCPDDHTLTASVRSISQLAMPLVDIFCDRWYSRNKAAGSYQSRHMRSIDDQTESCRCFSSHSQRLVEFGVFLFCRQKCTACSGTQLRTTSPLRVHSFQKKSTTHPQYQSAEEFRFQLSLFIVSFYFVKLNHFLWSTVRSNNIAERVIVEVVVNVVVVVVKFVLIHVEL